MSMRRVWPNNFGTVTAMMPPVLNMVDLAHRLVGPKPMQFLSDQWMKLPGHIMPAWNPYMPRVRPGRLFSCAVSSCAAS